MKTQRENIFLGLLILALSANSVFASETQNITVRETQSDSAFKGTLYQVWGRLRSLSPKTNVEALAQATPILTAGIRGTESTDTALKPYWKDDRSNDAQYLKQLEAYNAAQGLIDKGEMKAAAAGFGKFIDEYPGSELVPNAVFAEAMALAGMGEKDASIKQFSRFIKENPRHPLRTDAEMVIKELGGK